MNFIEEMNKMILQYLPEYSRNDIPFMKFSEDREGNIYFNDCYICPGNDLILQFTVLDNDLIKFYFNEDRFIQIELVWEEDTFPQIKSFGLGYVEK